MGSPYAFGKQSQETAQLQAALNAKNIDAGPADGIFGQQTRAAVIVVQNMLGVVATGTPDKAVLVYLGLLADAPKSNPITDYLTGLAVKAALNSLKGRLPMLSGYKTFATAIVLAVMGVYSLLFGDLPLVGHVDAGSAIMELLSALGLGFARIGSKSDVSKAVDKGTL